MPEYWHGLIDAFDREHDALTSVLDHLSDDDFALPTNCPPWDIRELVVHIAFSACTSANPAHLPAPGEIVIVAGDYYRRAARATELYRSGNVDQTQKAARRFPTPHDAIDRLRSGWNAAREGLAVSDPGRLVGGPRGVRREGEVLDSTALTLHDYLVTRLIALVAHAADIAISLGREPWTTLEALRYVTPALRDLLADDAAYERLAANDLTLMLLATGRQTLRPQDARRLGPAADRFPLLS